MISKEPEDFSPYQGRNRVHGVAVLTRNVLPQAIWEIRTATSMKTSKFEEVAHALP